MRKNQHKHVKRAITTSAIVIGGLSIPAFHNDAHADELNNNETPQVAENQTQNQNQTLNTSETSPQDNKSIEDVSNQVSAENETTNQPENVTSEKTEVASVEAPKEETTNEVEQPQEKTIATNESIEQPKEETTKSTQSVEQPKEEITNEVEQSKEETTESTQSVEQSKEETSESTQSVEQSKEETTESTQSVEQPKEDITSENQKLNDVNTVVSPFSSIDANVNQTIPENTPNSPSDNGSVVALNQPVTASRSIETVVKENNADETPTTNVLSSDKYTVVSLSGESQGGNTFEKPVYLTHLTLKLDDSVKAGDVLQFGAGYQYKDKDGNVTKQYFSPYFDETVLRTTSVMFDGKIIGKMTMNNDFFNTGYETEKGYNLYNPIYSVDELNNQNFKVSRNDKATIPPYTITFNDNIDNLKNVEITIDNVYNQPTFYKDVETSLDGTFQKNGVDYITVQNSFDINGNAQSLNTDVPINYRSTSVKPETTHDKYELRQSLSNRNYSRTPDGNEYLVNDGINGNNISLSLNNKEKINSATFTFTIPKELMSVLDVTINPENIQTAKNSANTLYNPLVNNENIFTDTDTFDTSNSDIWMLSSQNKSTNANGDTVYTLKYDTRDGSYVTPSQYRTASLSYNFKNKSDFTPSPLESYEEANKKPVYEKWSIPEWDALLKEHPITVTTSVNSEDNGVIDNTFTHNKEKYDVSIYNVQTAPKDGVKVLASNESVETVKKQEVIEFEIVREENPNLPKGEEKVTQEGENGLRTWDEEILYRDGVEVSRDKKNVNETPAKNKIIQVGTGIVDSTVTTEDVDIPFKTETRETSDLPAGESRTVQDGENGVKRITTTIPTLNGEPNGEPTTTEETIKEPINKVVEVGTGTVDSTVTTEDVDIPFETEERENPDLPTGETNVIQEGENGTKRITTTTPTLNGKPNGEPTTTEKTIKEPINKVVEVGTGIVDVTESTDTESIPFETVRVENPSLPEGTENVIVNGIDGERTITTVQPTLNGEPNGEPTVTSTITKEKQDKVIEVGTGVVSQDIQETERELPFNTVERVNPELPQGTRNVIQEGTNGLERTSVTYETLNGTHTKVLDKTVSVITEPQDRIIEIGSGVEGQNVTVKETVTPYDTVKKENPDLPKGYERIVTKGVDGITRTTTIDKTFNGTVTDTVSTSETVQDVTNEVIEVGTGIVGFETKDIPNTTKPETKYVENPNLPKGETRVIQEGKDGHTIKRIVTPTLNGKPNGQSDVVVITIDEPVDKIIEVGTKEEQTVIPPKDDTPSVEQPKEEQPKEEQPKEEQPKEKPQYPTPNHTHDHDGIHDNTPHDVNVPANNVTVKQTNDVKHHYNPVKPNVTLNEEQDGQMIVKVTRPMTNTVQQTENVQQPKVVKQYVAPTKQVQPTHNVDKELPQTGSVDNSKQAGILASVLGAVGLGFLFRRKKETDK